MQLQEQKLITDIKKAAKVSWTSCFLSETATSYVGFQLFHEKFTAVWLVALQDGNTTMTTALAKELIRVRQTTVSVHVPMCRLQ